MNIEQFRDFCLQLDHVTEETPFGPETLVFKVYGKVFALTDIDQFASINLKCDPERAVELRERYAGVTAGYHMNKKHWNTVSTQGNISDQHLKEWIKDSYDLVLKGVPKSLKGL